MIAIIDYGLGNLGSIANMFKVIGEKTIITSKQEDIEKADGVILPGVGAFDAGMQRLEDMGLVEVIRKQAKIGKPILGICLGMQLLGRGSEEGKKKGLELIPFECKKFQFVNDELKIPHMGWDIVDFKMNHELLYGLDDFQRYYFVHSYYAICDKSENVMMTCDYGKTFAAAVVCENVIGVQFHPEKSHNFGMNLLSNFVRICQHCSNK